MSPVPKAKAKRLVLLCWVLVAIFYFYLSYDFIRIAMSDGRFDDYLQSVAQLAGSDNRPAKEIRALILVRADELGLPVKADQITILGSGSSLNIEVDYDIDVDIPIFREGFYSKHFEHHAAYKQLN